MKLIDPCGRPVESLRISITQRCNLNCFYCHKEGERTQGNTEMSPAEIQRITEIAASFGIKYVKLTGGEPLIRKDIIEIIKLLKVTPGIKEVSMTTNGVLLAGRVRELKKAGLTRVNISLDTLMPEKFKKITSAIALESVIKGIKEAARVGLRPIKVNMVLLRGINEDEMNNMIDFAKKNDLILQIIELESPDQDQIYKTYHVSLSDIESRLKTMSKKVTVRKMHHRRKYYLQNGGKVEIVRPMHNTEFCKYCNRIRVTSDGKLKPCLFRADNLVDILRPIREGASEETLKNLFIESVNRREPYFK